MRPIRPANRGLWRKVKCLNRAEFVVVGWSEPEGRRPYLGALLPSDRVALYRAMLARAKGPDGVPLRLEGLKNLAWTMVTQRRRRIVPEDERALGVGTLSALEREGLRIVRSIGAEREFRHDQMRAFLASIAMTSSCFEGRFASDCGSGSGNASIADHS